MNLNTMIEQRDALNVEITRIQNERRAQHVAEIRALMAATGVTLTDLGAPAPPAPKVRFQRSAPVAPKYRDAAGNVFHTYSSYARGPEELIGTLMILDRAPKGRNEGSTMDFVRRHDEYEEKPKAASCCH